MKTRPDVDWKKPYQYLAALYYALLVVAGSIVVLTYRYFWSQYDAPVTLSDHLFLYVFPLYIALDVIRIPFAKGFTISLGFPVLLTILLVSSHPATAVPIAVAGSLLSELFYSLLRRRIEPRRAAMRAVLYASHHAVAGFAASVAYYSFNPSLETSINHLPAIIAYVLSYASASVLILWPHDWWVNHLLVLDDKKLPRVEVISTAVVMTPIPVVLVYLYELAKEPSRWIVWPMGLLFFFLLLLARSFARTEVQQNKGRVREFARKRIGSPPNLSELVQDAFEITGQLVDHRWAALYSTELGGQAFFLRGQERGDGSVEAYGLRVLSELNADEDVSAVQWPPVIKERDVYFGEVVRQGIPLVAYEKAPLEIQSFHLPTNTALIALPVRAEEEIVGLLALARSDRLFTLVERDKVQALTDMLGDTLYSVQRLESQLQGLYEEIDRFGEPEIVQQALNELLQLNVDVPRIMALVSERSFHTNLRAVLRGVVAGSNEVGRMSLPPDELYDIYRDVQGEARDMPAWSPEIGEKLQMVTSGLSLAFSFRYQWPELTRSPEYEALYKVLAEALDASTVPEILAQGPLIERAIGELRLTSLDVRDRIIGQLRRLMGVVARLREAEESDADIRVARLSDALRSLRAAEEQVRANLEDPERFALVQVAAAWQTIVTNALYAAREGGAQLAMALGSDRVLRLEQVAIQLKLENRGPGLAAGVVAEILPSQDYDIGDCGRVDVGPLHAGDSLELDFNIKPRNGRDTLRLVFEVTYRDRSRRTSRELFADRVRIGEKLSPFVDIDNPYLAGKPLAKGSPLFFGREDVFRSIRWNIASAARGKQILLLVGERRTGKTSIIKQLPERLRNGAYVHVFFDCQGLADPSMSSFFLKLSHAIARGVGEVGLSLEGLSPEELGDQPQYVFETKFLPRVWECIGDRSLLLAVDEFEALELQVRAGKLDPVIFPYLRSLMQSQGRMAFIFVGTHRVEELASEYWSVLFNIAKYKRIGFLDQESALRLITEPVRAYGVVYDDLALEEILHLTAGHPFYSQLLCDCLMEHCNDQRRNYVTVQDVRDVRDEIIELGRAHLVFVWQQSSLAEKATLAALTSLLHSRDQVTAPDIVEHLADRTRNLVDGVPFNLVSITRALERLISRDIVKETATFDSSYYAFTADLYRHFIARRKSLSKVVPELVEEAASVSPKGESPQVPGMLIDD